MKYLPVVGALCCLFAITIGAIGKYQPELFLKVPKVGFLLWLMSGRPLPPYFSTDAWKPEEMKLWVKDGDVIVATAAKSGTTWMLYCAHQIRTKGDPNNQFNFTDVSLSTPWPDLVQTPGSSWREQKPLLSTALAEEFGNRPLKDFWDNPAMIHHYPNQVTFDLCVESGGVLPVRQFPKVKFLAMARNGMDVIMSLTPFFNSHTEAFRKMWGGFPPASEGDLDKDLEARLVDLLPGGKLKALYFDYVKQWWFMRNEPNVLMMHYSDAVKDLRGTVAKLADFYEVTLTEAELEAVSQKCSMKHMKTVSNQFGYRLPLNKGYKGGILNGDSMVRNGGIGEGEAKLTEDQKRRWRQAEEDEFTDTDLLNWARNGGAFF